MRKLSFVITALAMALGTFVASGAAAQDTLFVTPTGKVGVGTSTPAYKLDVRGDAAGQPVQRLQSVNPTGYSGTEYYDSAGTIGLYFGLDNPNSNTRLNSINNKPIVILTNSVERMRFMSTGEIGIGTASPAARLHVAAGESRFDSNHATLNSHLNFSGNGQNYLRGTTIIADDAVGSNVGIGCDAPTSKLVVGGTAASCSTGPFSSINPGATSFTASSSRSIKTKLEVVDIPNLLEKILEVGVYSYDFIDGPANRIGLMAEDFHQIFGRGSEKMIDGGDVQMALWLAVQQLSARNKELEERLNAIETAVLGLPAGKTAAITP